LSLVVLHEDNILSMFFLAPNTILWTRNILLLLLWWSIVLLTTGTVVLGNEFFAVFYWHPQKYYKGVELSFRFLLLLLSVQKIFAPFWKDTLILLCTSGFF
jgi:hypothetical protein